MSNKAIIESTDLRDGLENLVAQLGTAQDKRHASTFVNNKMLSLQGQEGELNAMYRTDWLSGKVVDIIPDDMTREWREFTGNITPDEIKTLREEEDRLQLVTSFNLAHKWGRLYGTGYIVMSVDDSQTPDKPLDIENIKEGKLKHIKVLDRHELTHDGEIDQDPMSSNYGLPIHYRFNRSSSVRIHHTRVLRFDGAVIPFKEFQNNNYNHDSVLDRLYEAITNLNTTTHSSSSMVYETNVDVIKVKGLMNYLQTDIGETTLRKRFTLASVLKSFNNMLLLDTEEDFDKKSNTFSGLPDLIDRFAQLVSAGSDVPATRLLGSSASGLNATGEGDLKNYYDMIRSNQTTKYKPLLNYFDKIMAKSLGMSDESDLSYEFVSLFQMTPSEKAALQLVNAQRDQIYLDLDALLLSTIVKELKQERTYTNIEDDYIKELETFESEQDNDFNTDPNENQINSEEIENNESESDPTS